MKRKIAVVLMVVMLLMLTACTRKPKGTEIQYVEKNGDIVFAIYDYDAQTIRVGKTLASVYGPDGELIWEEDRKDEYRYEYDKGNITIYYPNGATYWESATDSGAVISWDGDYDPERYVDGSVLAIHLEKAYNQFPVRDEVVIVAIVCAVMIFFGVVSIKHPEILFELRYGLWFHSIEPTDHAILMTRVGGVVAIVGAVVLFLAVLFG